MLKLETTAGMKVTGKVGFGDIWYEKCASRHVDMPIARMDAILKTTLLERTFTLQTIVLSVSLSKKWIFDMSNTRSMS